MAEFCKHSDPVRAALANYELLLTMWRVTAERGDRPAFVETNTTGTIALSDGLWREWSEQLRLAKDAMPT